MNIKLTITFSGKDFNGWQSQKSKDSIQDIIENSLEKIYKQKSKIIGSSRTDREVNAINYVANFHPPFFIEDHKLIRAINSALPITIRVKFLEYVDEEFHARFSAKSKVYIYRLYNQTREHNYKIFDDFCGLDKNQLDFDKMQKTTQIFKGKHDFSAFSLKTDKSKECNIFYFKIRKIGNYYYFVIKGDRFLHKMVRFLVASVIDVGKGKLTKADVIENLEKKERIHLIKPVVAKGLFLKRVNF